MEGKHIFLKNKNIRLIVYSYLDGATLYHQVARLDRHTRVSLPEAGILTQVKRLTMKKPPKLALSAVKVFPRSTQTKSALTRSKKRTRRKAYCLPLAKPLVRSPPLLQSKRPTLPLHLVAPVPVPPLVHLPALPALLLAVLQARHCPRLFNSLAATLSVKRRNKKVVANLSRLTLHQPEPQPFLKLPWMLLVI